jgi:hypothetical protein
MGTLAVTEELHAKHQEAARKEAERAARKAPQDAAADAKGEAGEPASKKGSAARSSRPPGRPAIGGRACRAQAGRPGDELDGTPVRDAADLQLRLALPRIAAAEAGELYGPGLALMGLSLRRLIVLLVPRPRDALCRPIGREPA